MRAINVTDYAFVAMALVGHLGTQLTGLTVKSCSE
jgi:hypothetical protein